MRPLQPPPADFGNSAKGRRCPDPTFLFRITTPPSRFLSLVVPLPLPPSSAPSSSQPLEYTELERVSRIGRGVGRTVYKVLHRPTGKLYALKVIYGNHEDAIRNQMCPEIQILRDVDNPNIVKCHNLFDHNGEIQVLLSI